MLRESRTLVVSCSERDAIRGSAARFAHRPRVLFEEWYDPLISGICWVEELIETAGGQCISPSCANTSLPKIGSSTRRTSSPRSRSHYRFVVWARGEEEWIRKRDGWDRIGAIRNNHIYEVKSAYILQPGPAALTEGLRQLHAILAYAVNHSVDKPCCAKEKNGPVPRPALQTNRSIDSAVS